MAIELHRSIAVHAGEWLRIELVEGHGIAVNVLAAHLGVSRQGLSNVLYGHGALSADMALRFIRANSRQLRPAADRR